MRGGPSTPGVERRDREGVQGRSDEDEALNQLVTSHLGLARHLASRFEQMGETREDLAQVASVGLVKAARRFDPARGVTFGAYAAELILGELRRHLRDRGSLLHIPRPLRELYREVTAVTTELTHLHGRAPTIREVAHACGRDEVEVVAAIEVGHAFATSPLDDGAEGDGTLRRRDASPDDPIGLVDASSELAAHLSVLSECDQRLLRLRFEQELSQTQIAERLGISQVQVSRQLRDALQRLRRSFREHA